MKNLIIAVFITVLAFQSIYAQHIEGEVYGVSGEAKEKLNGAVIKLMNSKRGTTTDENGKFQLEIPSNASKWIIISYVGFRNDTVDISNKTNISVYLKSDLTTDVIKVQSKAAPNYLENTTSKTEILTRDEFKKEACCDLTGCFGNNSSIDIAVTDVVTDSRELKVLGLEGKYTQVLFDNQPIIKGVKTKYELSSIPGTQINSIKISKGTNSVIQGYESIGGIVNILLLDFEQADKLLVNAFMNQSLEKQLNVNYAYNLGEVYSFASFHTTQKAKRVDENGDGFLDMPLITRYSFLNKVAYGEAKDKISFSSGIRYWNEFRLGGQTTYNIGDEGSNSIYGQTVNINNGDIYGRLSINLGKDESIKILSNASLYFSKSFYGITKYNSDEKDFYLNSIYDKKLNDIIEVKLGAGYRYSNIKEVIEFTNTTDKTYAGEYVTEESIPGLFGEIFVKTLSNKLTLIPSARIDFHNTEGTIFTPRMLLKLEPFNLTTLRLTAGTGFRKVYVFNEYSNTLASSKNLIFDNGIIPTSEKVISFGIDLLQMFNFGDVSGNINLDYFRTYFKNKVIADYSTQPGAVVFYNISDNSYSDIFQADLNLTMFRIVNLKMSYKYLFSEYVLKGITFEEQFEAKHRVLASLTLTPDNDLFIFNINLHWFGQQVLPTTKYNPVEFQRPGTSDPYSVINSQLTKRLGNFEVYAGVENLLDYMQHHPIISASNPFGKYFDTSYIWGPVKGREFYAGFRFVIK